MILVDDAGGVIPAINHSPWNGVTLADFVMPFFLFIVGVSLGIAYKVVLLSAVSEEFDHLFSLKSDETFSIIEIGRQSGSY